MPKPNCWEIMNCGREVGGSKSGMGRLGACAASYVRQLDGVHGGQNGGRACWVVLGTICGGRVQGTFEAKTAMCATCKCCSQIRDEEGEAFVDTERLLSHLA